MEGWSQTEVIEGRKVTYALGSLWAAWGESFVAPHILAPLLSLGMLTFLACPYISALHCLCSLQFRRWGLRQGLFQARPGYEGFPSLSGWAVQVLTSEWASEWGMLKLILWTLEVHCD